MLERKFFIKLTLVIVVSFFIGILWLTMQENIENNKKSTFSLNMPQLALIRIEGVIMGGTSGFNEGKAGADTIMKEIREAVEDTSVKGILLRVDSPGGSAPASQEIANEIQKAKKAGKPIVVSMGDAAASGGYWVSAFADKIYANPATITGSIGVYMSYMNWQDLFNKIGVSEEKIKSGQHKDILSPNRPMTAEEKQIIQTIVNEIYNQFVRIVAEGRKLDENVVRKIADGRFYTGMQAKELGLVDEIGDLYDAVNDLAKMSGIEGKPKIKEYSRFGGFFDFFGSAKMDVLLNHLLLYFGKNVSEKSDLNQGLKNEFLKTPIMAVPSSYLPKEEVCK